MGQPHQREVRVHCLRLEDPSRRSVDGEVRDGQARDASRCRRWWRR